MPETFVSRRQRREKAVQKIINYAKADGIATKKEIRDAMGISSSTFALRMKDPGSFTLAEIWAVMVYLHTPEEQRGEILR